MMRVAAIAVAALLVQPVLAFAQDAAKQLAGSWKLTSWTIQVVGGEPKETFGPNPKGRAIFTPDGYVSFIIVAANRKPATNDAESAALLKTLLAYTGKFTIDGDKFTTKVDATWNELQTGTDQVRFFKVDGDKLTLRTPEIVSAVYAGQKVVGTLTWEREH
ncbi:MAG: lipocalin-like domain-containing protein [Bradyrhizobium sp.]